MSGQNHDYKDDEKQLKWFSESQCDEKDGLVFSLLIRKCLYEKVQPVSGTKEGKLFQIHETAELGRSLAVNGKLVYTEFEEACCQEMLTHIPMCLHSTPKHILVVCNDSHSLAILQQVYKHVRAKRPHLQGVTLLDENPSLVEVTQHFLANKALDILQDPFISVQCDDALSFLQKNRGMYDVVIVDDRNLSEEFVPYLIEAMNKHSDSSGGAVICLRAPNLWTTPSKFQSIYKRCRTLLQNTSVAFAYAPLEPCGQAVYIVAATNSVLDLQTPLYVLPSMEADSLVYYNPSVHAGAFAVPRLFKKLLRDTT